MSKTKLPPHKQLEAHFAYLHANPPAPFNPDYVHETAAEHNTRTVAMLAYSCTLPSDMPEDEKRVLRAKFYRAYWDAFAQRKRSAS